MRSRAIETAGREALDELRRLLGVLRREDAELTLAPQPSLRHVRSLAQRTTAAGLPVSLRVEGQERDLRGRPRCHRVPRVQDALGAALEHGGAGRADVWLKFAPDTLEILVRDDGPANEARPLMGIRERVVLHGGRLSRDRASLRRPRRSRDAAARWPHRPRAGGRRAVRRHANREPAPEAPVALAAPPRRHGFARSRRRSPSPPSSRCCSTRPGRARSSSTSRSRSATRCRSPGGAARRSRPPRSSRPRSSRWR